MDQRDVIIIGAGNAGQAAAGVLRKAGRSVVLIEGRDVGGTCPLRGCVPKKSLVATAEAMDVLARASDLGIEPGALRASWPRMMERKRAILAGTSESMEASLAASGVEVVHGLARFTSPDTVRVGERSVRAEHIVLATGSVPRPLALPGAELVLGSEDFLELPAAPADAIFLGAGPIAFEFAHVLARVGTRSHLLEASAEPLATLDSDQRAQVLAATTALGIVVESGATPVAVERRGDRFAVRYTRGGGEHEVTAAAVFHGAGRVAALAGLDLDRAEVATEHGGVALGAPFRSRSNPRVWVAGDALVGTPQLSPVATHEGKLVGRAILGEPVEAGYGSIPHCLYTVPTAASVGLSEAQARQQGIDVQVRTNDMTGWRSGRSYAERFAWAKVLLDGDTLVGAHLFGHGAGETIHLFALAMQQKLPASVLRDFVWAYPTFGSDIAYLL